MDLIRNPKNGDVLDATHTPYPSRLIAVEGPSELSCATSTHYGFVARGKARIGCAQFDLRAEAGAFFCVPGAIAIESDGLTVIIERLGFRGITLAGRIETSGRLAYIDGCSDTILVAPPRLGDPVLNFLHFPPGVVQTEHTHPTIRLGVVARGEGVAFGPSGQGGSSFAEPLTEGCIFLIHAHERHAFRTLESRTAMDVIAFHPDSDWGPTDGAHPMLNRTYLARG